MTMKELDEILPIGSVVRLRGVESKTIIVGILPVSTEDEEEEIHDYIGVMYPIGFAGMEDAPPYMFMHEDIEEIVFRGYENVEQKKMIQTLQELLDSVGQSIQEENA